MEDDLPGSGTRGPADFRRGVHFTFDGRSLMAMWLDVELPTRGRLSHLPAASATGKATIC